jgi:hypothetical protein
MLVELHSSPSGISAVVEAWFELAERFSEPRECRIRNELRIAVSPQTKNQE